MGYQMTDKMVYLLDGWTRSFLHIFSIWKSQVPITWLLNSSIWYSNCQLQSSTKAILSNSLYMHWSHHTVTATIIQHLVWPPPQQLSLQAKLYYDHCGLVSFCGYHTIFWTPRNGKKCHRCTTRVILDRTIFLAVILALLWVEGVFLAPI
jgi:hypothetical protein